MDRSPPLLTGLLTVVLVVAILRLGEPVLMPLVIAGLLSVVVTPAVRRIERIGFGRVPAVVLVALLMSGAVFSIGYVVVGQVGQIVSLLPEYRANVRTKVRTLREQFVPIERAAREMRALEEEIAVASEAGESVTRVEVVEKPPGTTDVLRTYLGSVAGPLGTIGLVVVMLIFILVQREDLRDRLLRVLGRRDLWVTTAAIDDAATRVTRYLRAYSMLNAGHGIAVALGLWALGLPAALLFGLLSGVLRFIPYVGPWIAAILPVTLSVAVFDSWTATFTVVAYLAMLELLSNNVFEPWLYGSSVGLSPFAVIVAAVFWAWVWGGIGLVVAIPLTVCVVVIGRRVPKLEFLAILLGDEPAFAPAVRLYQRLLAHDLDEADEIVESACVEHGVDAACDMLVLPALELLDYDRAVGRLAEDDAQVARKAFESFATTMVRCDEAKRVLDGERAQPAPERAARGARILCLPSSPFGDEIACGLLAEVLNGRGIEVSTAPRVLTGEMVDRALETKADVVCISALPPRGARVARHVCRQFAARDAEAQVLVALWGVDAVAEELRTQCEASCAHVVTGFADAARFLAARTGVEEKGNERAVQRRAGAVASGRTR